MTRRPAPRFPYQKALATVLPGWEVSLVFVGSTRAQGLNKKLRGKEYVPNVLSYTLGSKSGEIIICLSEAFRQRKDFALPFEEFVGLLFIHALLHLKGQPHGTTMDEMERSLLDRILTRTTTHETSHRSRDRHRHARNARGRC